MTPADLGRAVLAAARAVFSERDLDHALLPESLAVERPRNPEHGDYASTVAMQLAKKVGTNPRDLATAISAKLAEQPGIKSVEIAGPGFLNIRLDAGVGADLLGELHRHRRGVVAVLGIARSLDGE